MRVSNTLFASAKLSRQRLAALLMLCSTALSSPALASGTTAGTTISNTANASYTDSGGAAQQVQSNTISVLVDELLDVSVASADPGNIVAAPGATGQVLSFTLTNTGNGSESFQLASDTGLGGDQFNPTSTAIMLDTNGNGVYDPGVDTLYVAGSNDPLLAPDQTLRVFVIATIPGGVSNLDLGKIALNATAITGSGTPGSALAGLGQGGGDAVIGPNGGKGGGSGSFVIQSASVAFTKSAVIADPYGGAQPVPGATITYTLLATINGTGSLTNLAVSDTIPANTSYVPGSLTLQGAALSDASDGDSGSFSGTAVTVALGTVASGSTRSVSFRVTIN